jgi:succinate dehydrogenase/fumarate reductase flavoprotein subunit
MSRPRAWLIALGLAAGGVAFGAIRHGRRSMARKVPGGILVSNAAFYDLSPTESSSDRCSTASPRTSPEWLPKGRASSRSGADQAGCRSCSRVDTVSV